ncbi:cycloidea-like 9 [Anopheles sinensis]|uniref:Cycloidea-like 9 n=1 Tax=Anopheles sinensis TaxID=74873 RepID=A0A084WTU8_ANOSI|nr:cycloidea-like 9 [Anopheles sinensis]
MPKVEDTLSKEKSPKTRTEKPAKSRNATRTGAKQWSCCALRDPIVTEPTVCQHVAAGCIEPAQGTTRRTPNGRWQYVHSHTRQAPNNYSHADADPRVHLYVLSGTILESMAERRRRK